MNPLITIGLPTCHRLHYLPEAVASALAQTYLPFAVLIRDDGPVTEIGPWARARGPGAGVRFNRRLCAHRPGGCARYRLLFAVWHKGLVTKRPPHVS